MPNRQITHKTHQNHFTTHFSFLCFHRIEFNPINPIQSNQRTHDLSTHTITPPFTSHFPFPTHPIQGYRIRHLRLGHASDDRHIEPQSVLPHRVHIPPKHRRRVDRLPVATSQSLRALTPIRDSTPAARASFPRSVCAAACRSPLLRSPTARARRSTARRSARGRTAAAKPSWKNGRTADRRRRSG